MFERLLIGFFVPVVALALSIPMILGKVSPNKAYGFRTPKTLSSPEIWYAANRAAGGFMAGAAVISIAFNLALWWAVPEWSPEKMKSWMIGGTMVPLLMSVAASFLYLRRL
jgi:uncharacterized membrane protein